MVTSLYYVAMASVVLQPSHWLPLALWWSVPYSQLLQSTLKESSCGSALCNQSNISHLSYGNCQSNILFRQDFDYRISKHLCCTCMLLITQRDVELVEGYGIYLSKWQLDKAVDTAGGSQTKLIRNLIGVFFTRDVLASSSVYGKGKILQLIVMFELVIIIYSSCIIITCHS